jgi:hypothetical protein
MQENPMPVEFKHMVRQIGYDLVEQVGSMGGLVPYALIGVEHPQAAVVRQFLQSLLAKKFSAEEMSDFWSSTPSGVYFADGERVREFLSSLLKRLEQEPYLTGKI